MWRWSILQELNNICYQEDVFDYCNADGLVGDGFYNISKRGIDQIGSAARQTQMAYITYALSTTQHKSVFEILF